MVLPDTFLDSMIKKKLDTMKMSQFNQDVSKENFLISYQMNHISISIRTYSEIVGKTFNLWPSLSCPLFCDYMDIRRRKWEEHKDFTSDQVRAMALKNQNNLITSERWSTKDPND